MKKTQEKRTAVFVSGRGSNMQKLIEATHKPGFPAQIVLVISDKADAPAIEKAKHHNIDVSICVPGDFADGKSLHHAMDQLLREKRVDIICLAGYMRLLEADFVKSWLGKIINIHPSLLPKFRGLNTHQRAIEEGAKKHGCTVHFVDEGLDTGPVIEKSGFAVSQTDTAETLAKKVREHEHRLYPKILDLFARGRVSFPSPEAPRLTKKVQERELVSF